MNYAFNITTPIGTTKENKQRSDLVLIPGVVTKVEVQFPPGSAGLLYAHINRGVHQVWPHNPDYQYIGDDQTIIIPANYRLVEPPYQFELYTWNIDDTYDHMIIIRFDVMAEVSEERLTPEFLEEAAAARGVDRQA